MIGGRFILSCFAHSKISRPSISRFLVRPLSSSVPRMASEASGSLPAANTSDNKSTYKPRYIDVSQQ